MSIPPKIGTRNHPAFMYRSGPVPKWAWLIGGAIMASPFVTLAVAVIR